MSRSRKSRRILETVLLPLRDVVIFPSSVVPLFVGRPSSVSALEFAMSEDKRLLLVTQRAPEVDEPGPEDIHPVGTLCEVLQCMRLPDGSVKVIVQGLERYRVLGVNQGKGILGVSAERVETIRVSNVEAKALTRSVMDLFEEYVRLNRRVPQEAILSLNGIEEPGLFADTVATHCSLKVTDKQAVLAEPDPRKRLRFLAQSLSSEVEILQIEKKIRGEVRRQMEKSQKDYYLNEQIKAIQRELGREGENGEEIARYREKINETRLPKVVREKVEEEIRKLGAMPPMSPESTVVRNYLDWIFALPWKRGTKDRLDLTEAEKILNEDHYGLKRPKERILEFLAVRQLVEKIRGPILCFVGPPGVGKTSLGRSVARALKRKFVRISLGGVRDEAEIRGHRKTYIGALPGRILQMMRKAGSVNPVFLLDEVDKMSADFRGDPAAALLEVLDPELNHTFVDHYLELEYDLSRVLFITTANFMDPIPSALRDRMEVIEVPSYTSEEKFHIAKDFLIPKQLKANGLKGRGVSFDDETIRTLIHSYTREAGVRNLEREISNTLRKVGREVAAGKASKRIRITPKQLSERLGPPRFRSKTKELVDAIGVSTGLAWTEAGGEVLFTEVAVIPGSGELHLTGKLGEVMRESARAALTYARSRADQLHLKPDFHKNCDLHIHVPEGAIPKDGPSAGITLATALISALSGRSCRADVAMTGEITLRGRVLPVGGVKEKILSAHRAGITDLILPAENNRDLKEIPEDVLRNIQITFVEDMDQVLAVALRNGPDAQE